MIDEQCITLRGRSTVNRVTLEEWVEAVGRF